MIRRNFWKCIGAAAGMAITATARITNGQEAYPVKPVRVLVSNTIGGGGVNDAIARIVLQKLSEVLGQTFIAGYRFALSGDSNMTQLAKAKPDGYTLLLTANSAQVVNSSSYKNVSTKSIQDFAPVGLVASTGYVLVANAAFPANSVADLIALAKAKPGQIRYAANNNGTVIHMIGLMFKRAAGIDMVRDHYGGSDEAAANVADGSTPVSFLSVPSALPYIQSGKIKVLGVVNKKRLAFMPKSPTIGETLPGFGITLWHGLLAPAGTPKDVIEKLQAGLTKALADKGVIDQLAAQGCEVLTGSSDEFAALIHDDLPRMSPDISDL